MSFHTPKYGPPNVYAGHMVENVWVKSLALSPVAKDMLILAVNLKRPHICEQDISTLG